MYVCMYMYARAAALRLSDSQPELVSTAAVEKLRAWAQAFSKHAPRLRLTVLNITAMSEGRADARVRDGACGSFCYPGVPHHWAEMLIRLLEQQVYGGTDGLYDRSGLPGR